MNPTIFPRLVFAHLVTVLLLTSFDACAAPSAQDHRRAKQFVSAAEFRLFAAPDAPLLFDARRALKVTTSPAETPLALSSGASATAPPRRERGGDTTAQDSPLTGAQEYLAKVSGVNRAPELLARICNYPGRLWFALDLHGTLSMWNPERYFAAFARDPRSIASLQPHFDALVDARRSQDQERIFHADIALRRAIEGLDGGAPATAQLLDRLQALDHVEVVVVTGGRAYSLGTTPQVDLPSFRFSFVTHAASSKVLPASWHYFRGAVDPEAWPFMDKGQAMERFFTDLILREQRHLWSRDGNDETESAASISEGEPSPRSTRVAECGGVLPLAIVAGNSRVDDLPLLRRAQQFVTEGTVADAINILVEPAPLLQQAQDRDPWDFLAGHTRSMRAFLRSLIACRESYDSLAKTR